MQLIKKFPTFYGTPKFITVLTSVRHLSLSWANSIESPQSLPTSWRCILILSSHLRLGLPNGLFSSGFPTKTLCTPVPSALRADTELFLLLFSLINALKKAVPCLKVSLIYSVSAFLVHLTKQENISCRAVYAAWPHGSIAPVDVNLHTHGNIHDYTRNYETQKGKETEKYFALQKCVFEITPSEIQGVFLAAYFSLLCLVPQ